MCPPKCNTIQSIEHLMSLFHQFKSVVTHLVVAVTGNSVIVQALSVCVWIKYSDGLNKRNTKTPKINSLYWDVWVF